MRNSFPHVARRHAWIVIVVAIIACESDSPTQTELPPNTIASGGGTLTFDNGNFKLTVPPGALPSAVTFSVTKMDTILPGLGSACYRVGPAGTNFGTPATLRIRVDPDSIGDLADIGDLTAAVILPDGTWQGVPATADPVTREVIIPVFGIDEPELLPVTGDTGTQRGGGAVIGYAGTNNNSNNPPPAPTCDFDVVLGAGQDFAALLPKYVAADGTGNDVFDGSATRPWATIANSVPQLALGQKLVVRGGAPFQNSFDPPGPNVETFPVVLPPNVIIEGDGGAVIRASGSPAATVPDAVFKVTSSPNHAYVKGLTVECDPIVSVPVGNLDRHRIALVTMGSPTFESISSQTAGGFEIQGTDMDPPASIRGGSLRSNAGRIDIYGGNVVILSTSFQGITHYADAESAAVFIENGSVCIEGLNVQGGHYGVHAALHGNLQLLNGNFQGPEIGVLFGRIPVDPATDVAYDLHSNQFRGCRRAAVATASPASSESLDDNTYDNDPPVEWWGPPPFIEPVDQAHLLLNFGNPRWWPLDRPEPTARFGAATAFDHASGVFVLFGGRSGANVLDDTWVFDRRTFTWTEVTPAGIPPTARFEHCMATVPSQYRPTNNVYLVGGHTGGANDTFHPMNEIYIYDSTGDWNLVLATGTPPPPRYAATWVAALESEEIYLYGGIDENNNVLSDMWSYDIPGNAWQPVTPIGTPIPRAYHQGAAYPGGVLYYGGISTFGGEPVSNLSRVTTGRGYRDVTQTGATTPPPLSLHNLVRVHDRGDTGWPRFVLFGGATTGGAEFFGNAYVFHVDETGTDWDEGFWEPIDRTPGSPEPTGRGRSCMFQWLEPSRPNDNILVFGGVNSNGATIADSYIYMAGGAQ